MRGRADVKRRGQHQWNIIALILVLTTIIVGVVFIISFSGVWRTEEVKVDCTAQIRTYAATQAYSKELLNPSTIHCPTNILTVQGETAAKAVIADEMLRCFNQWGRGDLALFGNNEGTYCHVCGMVYVTGTPSVRGLTQYLDANKPPKGAGSYLQQIAGVTRGDLYAASDAPAPTDESLATDKPIGVIFRYQKGQQLTQRVSNWLSDPKVTAPTGFVGGAAVGVAVGASGGTVAFLAVGAGVVSAVAGYAYGVEPLDTVASVHAQTLDPGSMGALGCDYAPVDTD